MATGDSILDFGFSIFLGHGFLRYTANPHPIGHPNISSQAVNPAMVAPIISMKVNGT